MAAIAVAHDHLFHGKNSPLLPHHHHIKQRPPPPTSRCACAFSSPTTSYHQQHHLHHRSTSQLPTSPKRIPSTSSSSADSRSVAESPSSPSKTKKTPSSSKTSATSRAHFQELLSRSLGAGDYDKAFHCLRRLVSAGYRPKVVPCTKLIKGLSSTSTSSDSLRRAKWVMEILELHGSPDTVAYTAFLDALCRFNQVDTALSFLPRMRRRLCPPNNITYNVLIRELCLRGRHDDALDLFRRMPEDDLSQPCVVTYTILIEAYISVGAVAEAVRLLEDMLSRGLSLDSHTYRAIIRGLCREGLVDEAWQLVRQQKSSGSGSDPESGFPTVGSYNILLKGLLGKKRWRDAGVLVEEMFADGHLEPDVVSYSSLVLSFCQEGMVENALSLLDDMVRRGPRPNSQCIDPVINACCKQGMVGLAMASVERMVAAGCVLDIVNYNKILGALCKSGKARDAARLLWELERTGCEPNTSSYNAVVGGLWAEGERQMAVELVGKMLAKGLVADEVTYNMLVTCLCRDGMVDKAMDLVGIMEEFAGLSPTATTYNTVLLTLCEEGRLVEAIDVFLCKMMRRMGTSSRRKSGGNAGTGRITRPRDSTYEILVEGIAFGGHKAEVAELVNVLITSNVISENSKRRIRMRMGHWNQQEEEEHWR